MTAHWPASTISSVLHSLFPTDSDFYPTVLLTFDSSGISSHPNHISARLGAKEYIASLPLASPRPALYTLTTIPIYRKYLSWFDLISTILFPPSPSPEINAQKEEGKLPARLVFMSGWEDFKTARAAMTQAHVSQMRWFRYGWILWSRYMVINELRLEGHGKKER